ncbi:hypothetical protein F8M41_016799 [Gigaspora margarita]|uniref:Uncharacterized protein n=1 Tax=Gigaspora margarita TaxID=4874 RepID=A0A8H4ANY6_GIGMA|nr:hypothetical protein F8M41_016799 [Gigaspora margarita]
MHKQYPTCFFLIILFNFASLTFSCQVGDNNDYLCGLGFVCSSAPSTYGQCIYGCHHDNDCPFDTTVTQNQKCDTNLTTWSCTCGSNTACPGDGQCYKGHCVISNYSGVGHCNHPTLEFYFDNVCKWVVKNLSLLGNPTVSAITAECNLALIEFIEAEPLVLLACGAIAKYIVGAQTDTAIAADVTCNNAWKSICNSL